MHFASDNWAAAHPAITSALHEYSEGFSPSYGGSEFDRAAEQRFAEIFEHDVAVYFLPTGTAANSLALASVYRTGGIAFAHSDAHLREDECGAPEFLTGGVRIRPVAGPAGKIGADTLATDIEAFVPGNMHVGRAVSVSITQTSEIGTVYELPEIEAISAICRRHKLPLHMDGARFANAISALDCSPADMTWRRGVDVVSFGGTKNGCWCAEALIFFDPEMGRDIPFLRKRSGQLFSKSRFVAAQFLAYFNNGLWLQLASHANAMSDALAAVIRSSENARLGWESQANEVFAILSDSEFKRLQAEGVEMADWPAPTGFDVSVAPDETLVRFVTSFSTNEEHIARFADILR